VELKSEMNSKPLTILLAEDDENDLYLLKRALQKIGIPHSVHICRDGEEATNYLQGSGTYSDRGQFPFPSIIITDLKMPRKSGFEILRWLNDHPECHVIPVIVLSASNEPQDIKEAYRAGANCYLMKPSKFDDLKKILRVTFEFWSLCERPEIPTQG